MFFANMYFSSLGIAASIVGAKELTKSSGWLWFKTLVSNVYKKIAGVVGTFLANWIVGGLMIFPVMAIFAWLFYSSIFKGILHVIGVKTWSSWNPQTEETPENEENEEKAA